MVKYNINDHPEKIFPDDSHSDQYSADRKSMNRPGMILDRYYIPTGYPKGLPDITPDRAFNEEDAQLCLEYGKMIIETVESFLTL